mmetsp:Transcript_38024/g.65633  ORF Transcript_38024/g.65633 Transcript_38024/m.65633 type:complete len:326 (+) Transcript_38024:222-1199(+)
MSICSSSGSTPPELPLSAVVTLYSTSRRHSTVLAWSASSSCTRFRPSTPLVTSRYISMYCSEAGAPYLNSVRTPSSRRRPPPSSSSCCMRTAAYLARTAGAQRFLVVISHKRSHSLPLASTSSAASVWPSSRSPSVFSALTRNDWYAFSTLSSRARCPCASSLAFSQHSPCIAHSTADSSCCASRKISAAASWRRTSRNRRVTSMTTSGYRERSSVRAIRTAHSQISSSSSGGSASFRALRYASTAFDHCLEFSHMRPVARKSVFEPPVPRDACADWYAMFTSASLCGRWVCVSARASCHIWASWYMASASSGFDAIRKSSSARG